LESTLRCACSSGTYSNLFKRNPRAYSPSMLHKTFVLFMQHNAWGQGRSAIRRISRAIANDILDNMAADSTSVLLEKYIGEKYDRPRSRTLATIAQVRIACAGGCSSAWLYPMGFE